MTSAVGMTFEPFLLPAGGFCGTGVPLFCHDADVDPLFSSAGFSSGFIDFVDIMVPSIAIEIEVLASCHDRRNSAMTNVCKPCHDLGRHCHDRTFFGGYECPLFLARSAIEGFAIPAKELKLA